MSTSKKPHSGGLRLRDGRSTAGEGAASADVAATASPQLSRSITLGGGALTLGRMNKELAMRQQSLRKAPMRHAVERTAEDRVMKNVPVPEPCLLDSNVLFDEHGKPFVSLLRSHLSREGLLHTLMVVIFVAFFFFGLPWSF